MLDVQEISMPMTDREFNKSVAANRMCIGMGSEMICAGDLYYRGYRVSKPLDGTSKYDLIVDRHGVLSRLQVKTVSKGGQTSIGVLSYREDTYGKGVVIRVIPKYDGTEFEFLAVVDRATREVFYVPIADVDFTKANFPLTKAARLQYTDF